VADLVVLVGELGQRHDLVAVAAALAYAL